MIKSKKLLKLLVLAMLIALGVVISPILRVEGMCPMAHFINVVCAVLLGPWYSLVCAVAIGIIRMLIMGIPPLALTGAVFGAFLSGVLYKASKGKLLFAVLGEVIGTGIIGAIVSYPVMTFLWGKEGLSWFFYVPSFICGTLIGGSLGFAFLKKLASNGLLKKFQLLLGSDAFDSTAGILGNGISVASIGVLIFVVISIAADMFELTSPVWTYTARGALIVFVAAAVIYCIVKCIKSGAYKNAKKDGRAAE